MPRLSTFSLRAALVCLVAGAGLGALQLAGVPVAGAREAHGELALSGWLGLLVPGVAWWILPRPAGRPHERPRAVVAACGVGALAAGLTLSVAAAFTLGPSALPAARAVQLAGAVLFAAAAWPRVRALWPGVSAADRRPGSRPG